MTRLGRYLVRLFSAESAALFGVALTIIYLAQTLRIIDVSTVRDRGLGTVLIQTFLALPTLSVAFLYLCLAVGLARALRTLQTSRELHIIHASGQLPVLLRAILGYALAGTVIVLFVAHVVTPSAQYASSRLQAEAAADLVGRSLVPNRFAELGEGVAVTVGGRGRNGEITSFFADDRRDPLTRRTYIADSALLTQDEEGYVLQLQQGTMQYRSSNGEFSEISFDRYDIALDRLTGEADERGDRSTWALVRNALEEGDWSTDTLRLIAERTAEGLRVLALCLFVAAVCAFPSGRRREPLVPIEVSVLGVVLLERVIASYAPISGWPRAGAGIALLILVTVPILLIRLRAFSPLSFRRGAP